MQIDIEGGSAARKTQKGPAARSVCSGLFSPKLFYVILSVPLHGGVEVLSVSTGGLAPSGSAPEGPKILLLPLTRKAERGDAS